MKIKNISHIIVSVLFLFAYHVNTLHSNQHFLEESDCHLCVASKQLNTNTHKTSIPVFVELNTLETSRTEQRLSLKKPLVPKLKPLVKRVDFSGMHAFTVASNPLGYFSHAPPHTFS